MFFNSFSIPPRLPGPHGHGGAALGRPNLTASWLRPSPVSLSLSSYSFVWGFNSFPFFLFFFSLSKNFCLGSRGKATHIPNAVHRPSPGSTWRLRSHRAPGGTRCGTPRGFGSTAEPPTPPSPSLSPSPARSPHRASEAGTDHCGLSGPTAPLRQGRPREHCTESRPDRSGISLTGEGTQPPWAACPSAPSPAAGALCPLCPLTAPAHRVPSARPAGAAMELRAKARAEPRPRRRAHGAGGGAAPPCLCRAAAEEAEAESGAALTERG